MSKDKTSQDKISKRVQFEYRDPKTLKPYKNNPRINDETVPVLVKAIEKHGFLIPILVDKDNVIIAGHTRYLAAKELGLTEVPVVVDDDTDEKSVDAFRLVDNKIAEMSSWDFEKLADEVGMLHEAGIDLTETGFSESEISCLVDTVGDDDSIFDEPDGVNVAFGHNEGFNTNAVTTETMANVIMIKVGVLKFPVAKDVYEKWVHDIRAANEFDIDATLQDLAERIGLEILENSLAGNVEEDEGDVSFETEDLVEEGQGD